MSRVHRYRVEVEWTGNRGSGTSGYRAYAIANSVNFPVGVEPVFEP